MHAGTPSHTRTTSLTCIRASAHTVDPDSELGRALGETDGEPVVLLRRSSRFRVTRDPDDPRATDDPAKLRTGLKQVTGLLSPEEGDWIVKGIYRIREEGPRPLDRS